MKCTMLMSSFTIPLCMPLHHNNKKSRDCSKKFQRQDMVPVEISLFHYRKLEKDEVSNALFFTLFVAKGSFLGFFYPP